MPSKAPRATRAVTLIVGLEGAPPPETTAAVFVFDASGILISHAPLHRGEAKVHLPTNMTARARIFVGPAPKEGQPAPTLDALARLRPYQPVFDFKEPHDRYAALPVPEPYWRYWLWCECRIRGEVVRNINGVDYPVCNARVHVCQVEPFFIFLNSLSDIDILRLRDDFRAALASPTLPLPPPGPDPALRMLAAVRPNHRLENLSTGAMAALQSHSPTLVRQALTENVTLLRPYWCLWPWWWWWFERCVEIAVLTTNDLGQFDFEYWNLCEDDNDLYFWVEYCIGGVWTPVYDPPAPCNTYWDYVCGTQVTLRVTDERVPVCGAEPDLPGLSVVLMTIGNNYSPAQIQPAASGGAEGLTVDGRPFGGSIEPHVAFSRSALIGSGITHYRWSYRQLTAGDGVTPAVGSWTQINTPVYRHYEIQDPNPPHAVSFPTDLMGPDPGYPGSDLFKIQPIVEPGEGYAIADARADTASAFMITSPPISGSADPNAGRYELKLELFRPAVDPNTPINLTDEGIAVATATTLAPFGAQTVTTTTASPEHVIVDGSGKVVAMRAVLRIDNSHCDGNINDIVVGGGSGVGPCGFYNLPSQSSPITVSFTASYPNGLATYGFEMARGSSGVINALSASGLVTDLSDNGYARSGDTFSRTFIASDLFNIVDPPQTPPGCDRGAFAELLNVYALATDGWNRLGYDAPRTALGEIGLKAFALTP